jgi:hypothetical protein
MKITVAIFRNVMVMAVLFTSLNLLSSCDSCNRPSSNESGTATGQQANGDNSATERPGANEDSGSQGGNE